MPCLFLSHNESGLFTDLIFESGMDKKKNPKVKIMPSIAEKAIPVNVSLLKEIPSVPDMIRKGIPTYIKSFDNTPDCSCFKTLHFTKTANMSPSACILQYFVMYAFVVSLRCSPEEQRIFTYACGKEMSQKNIFFSLLQVELNRNH